jgi:DNA (cytosine-5)-methyltransferase 1
VQQSQTKYGVLSLFSGCGGLDLGFQGGFRYLDKTYKKNNFEIVWSNDIDKNACLTYQNYFKHPIICGDIREIIFGDNRPMLESPLPLRADIVLGGFPCQDFSHAGKRRGFESRRGTLYQAMSKVVHKTKPLMFLAENVKGLMTMNQGKAIDQIVSDFAALGYHVSYRLLLTADFGVPQKRERVVIIGSRKDVLPKYDFDLLTSSDQECLTLGMAIGDLESRNEGDVENHYWSKAKKNKGQGNNAVAMDRPGPTMRAEHHGNIEFHWNNKRRLSAREAARIQSFPDDMIFLPSTSSAYKQIGNAVPPVFAWHLAKSIETFLCRNFHPEKLANQESGNDEIS